MSERGFKFPTGPVSAVITVIGDIVHFLFGLGSGMNAFVHDVGVSLKVLAETIAGPILGAFDLVKGWIIGLLKRIKKIIEVLQEKIGNVLGPIIRIMKRMRDFWDNIFKVYVQPILNTIQHIRQTLTIFKVFHLKFATALDSRLAKLEGDIAERMLIVKQQLNKYLSILELWADPAGFIRGSAIWGGLLQSMAGLGALVRGFGFGTLLPNSERKPYRTQFDEQANDTNALIHRFRTNSLSTDEQQHVNDIQGMFR